MAEDSSSGSQLSNFQYLAHLLDPYSPPLLNLSEHLQRTCEHRQHVKCWNEGTQQLPQNNKENPTWLFGFRFRLIFKHNLCWGWHVSTLEKKLGFGQCHALPCCLTMGYTVCKICNYMYLEFHGFKMIQASSSPWFTGHPPLRGASWKSWAMPWDHRSYNPRRSRSENAGCGGLGLDLGNICDVHSCSVSKFKSYLLHFSKEHYLDRVCKRAKRRGPDPMEYLIAFFSLSLSLVCSICVCARVRCIAISLQDPTSTHTGMLLGC